MILARRHLLRLGSVFAILHAGQLLVDAPVTIRMRSDADGAHVGFAPVGLLIQPSGTVRLHCEANYFPAQNPDCQAAG
ncbi:MAG TPA: hypothetical protein VKI44_15375 [Acetobacteraceae bacterium]|nr:hypothetical protein [Acetobacteraceae bacterium]